jgi:hypothetical protein
MKWHLAAWLSGLGCLLIAFLIWQFLDHLKRVAVMAAQLEDIHQRNTSELTRDDLHSRLSSEHNATRAHITSVMDDGVRKDVEITKTRMDGVERMVQKIALFFGVKL